MQHIEMTMYGCPSRKSLTMAWYEARTNNADAARLHERTLANSNMEAPRHRTLTKVMTLSASSGASRASGKSSSAVGGGNGPNLPYDDIPYARIRAWNQESSYRRAVSSPFATIFAAVR